MLPTHEIFPALRLHLSLPDSIELNVDLSSLKTLLRLKDTALMSLANVEYEEIEKGLLKNKPELEIKEPEPQVTEGSSSKKHIRSGTHEQLERKAADDPLPAVSPTNESRQLNEDNKS